MKASRSVTVTATALLVSCLLCSVFLLHHLDQVRPNATLEEVLYVPSPKVLKHLSLGYDGLMADIYWTRAVQYFGGHHHVGNTNYELLSPLLEITTTLDPHLMVAYEFGANFLSEKPPNGAGQPERAIDLVQYGIRNNPNEWHLYYNLGFIYYMSLKDYGRAAEAFEQGSKVPNAHPWMKVLAAQMAGKSGDIRTARMLWAATHESSNDKMIRANAAAHLRALQVDEDVTALESLVAQYKDRTGRLPRTFSDMITVGLLRGIPRDPRGYPYELTSDGRIEVFAPNDLPFIQKGLAPGYVAPSKIKILPSD
jgi:hypothetical protein